MRLRSPTVLALFFLFLCLFATVQTESAESTQSNSVALAEGRTNAGSKNWSRGGEEDSFADMIDRALEREFSENEETQEEDASGFNSSVAEQQFHDVFHNENGEEDMPTLIDQKVITGYLLAGSVIGPGGLSFVCEMVQVETVAQFGVIFLLFALGLEFLAVKLRVVRIVAVLAGLLQIFLFMCLCGITAALCGGRPSEGVFIGAFLSLSSTAVVLKFLMERNSISALHGQVVVGTLILQDVLLVCYLLCFQFWVGLLVFFKE